ncbi:hypothetical protein TB1_006427 [Malus domestica]
MVKLMNNIIPSSFDVEKVDLFSHFPKDKGDASVELGELSESDTDSESSLDQDSRILFKDRSKWAISHRDEDIVGLVHKGVKTRRQIADEVANVCYVF